MWVPQKSADFGETAPALKHLRSRCSTKKNPFGAIFVEFGDTKNCCSFSGLELAPKSRKKLIGALSCMHKGPKYIQTLWDHPKKFLLCKSTKKSRYVRSLGIRPHFEAFPEAKKANWRFSCMHKSPKCIQTLWDRPNKIPLLQKYNKNAICAILREKPILGHNQRLKKVLHVLRCAKNTPQRP